MLHPIVDHITVGLFGSDFQNYRYISQNNEIVLA